MIVPERRVAAADPAPFRPEPFKADPPSAEPARSAPLKLAAQKPVPVPLPQSPSPRQDSEDAQSVLARLRQTGPGLTPPQQADIVPAPEPRPRPVPSPTSPKLNAARSALGSGRVEEARRLLQEAQLQLVFRPVDAAGEDLPSAAKRAADVAHALEALSANDLPLSLRYIDAALGDASLTGINPPVQQSDRRPFGYAPAYPTR